MYYSASAARRRRRSRRWPLRFLLLLTWLRKRLSLPVFIYTCVCLCVFFFIICLLSSQLLSDYYSSFFFYDFAVEVFFALLPYILDVPLVLNFLFHFSFFFLEWRFASQTPRQCLSSSIVLCAFSLSLSLVDFIAYDSPRCTPFTFLFCFFFSTASLFLPLTFLFLSFFSLRRTRAVYKRGCGSLGTQIR